MNALAQAKRIWANLMALGAKRLATLALVGGLVFALTGFAGWYLSRPTQETLYSGLDREDVVQHRLRACRRPASPSTSAPTGRRC